MNTAGAFLTQILRAPADVARRCREDEGTRDLAIFSMIAIVVGGAVFGAAVGSFRGGLQTLFAAAKVPLALLATLALSVPAFHAMAAALGRPWPLRKIAVLSLCAAGRASFVLLALAPLVWLGISLGTGYHTSSLLASMAFGAAGLTAIGLLIRGLGQAENRWVIAAAFVTIFFATGSQTAWILRPYLSRPAKEVVFIRAFEGGPIDSLTRSGFSAAGLYDWSAPRRTP